MLIPESNTGMYKQIWSFLASSEGGDSFPKMAEMEYQISSEELVIPHIPSSRWRQRAHGNGVATIVKKKQNLTTTPLCVSFTSTEPNSVMGAGKGKQIVAVRKSI